MMIAITILALCFRILVKLSYALKAFSEDGLKGYPVMSKGPPATTSLEVLLFDGRRVNDHNVKKDSKNRDR